MQKMRVCVLFEKGLGISGSFPAPALALAYNWHLEGLASAAYSIFLRRRLGSTMVVRASKTRLKGLEALLSLLSCLPHSSSSLLRPLFFPPLDMSRLPLIALFGVAHHHGARCCYRAGDAETVS